MPDSDLEQDFHDPADIAAAEQSRQADDAVTGRDGGSADEDDMRAADGLTVTDGEAAAYRDSVERGAHQQGEGAPEV